jgi:hypothetical protein
MLHRIPRPSDPNRLHARNAALRQRLNVELGRAGIAPHVTVLKYIQALFLASKAMRFQSKTA